MNGPASHILTDAAVFRGELHRVLLSLGIVLMIMFLIWAVEALRERKKK